MKKFRIKDPTGSFFNPTDGKKYSGVQEFQADETNPVIKRSVQNKIIFETGVVKVKTERKARKAKDKKLKT